MIVIRQLSETKYSFADVHSLIKEVYTQRTQEGIHFRALTESTFDLEQRIKNNNGIVFVALNEENDELVGTGTILFKEDKHHIKNAGFILAAVLPKYQGQGIGTLLRVRREQCAKEQGCKYISSSTAVDAKSSIRYHLKTGAKRYSYLSFRDTDYYSVVFHKYLVKSFNNNAFICAVHYYFSWIITKLLYLANGEKTLLGRVLSLL